MHRREGQTPPHRPPCSRPTPTSPAPSRDCSQGSPGLSSQPCPSSHHSGTQGVQPPIPSMLTGSESLCEPGSGASDKQKSQLDPGPAGWHLLPLDLLSPRLCTSPACPSCPGNDSAQKQETWPQTCPLSPGTSSGEIRGLTPNTICPKVVLPRLVSSTQTGLSPAGTSGWIPLLTSPGCVWC